MADLGGRIESEEYFIAPESTKDIPEEVELQEVVKEDGDEEEEPEEVMPGGDCGSEVEQRGGGGRLEVAALHWLQAAGEPGQRPVGQWNGRAFAQQDSLLKAC